MVTGKDEFLSSRAQLLRRWAALATFRVAPASKPNSIAVLVRGLRQIWRTNLAELSEATARDEILRPHDI